MAMKMEKRTKDSMFRCSNDNYNNRRLKMRIKNENENDSMREVGRLIKSQRLLIDRIRIE